MTRPFFAVTSAATRKALLVLLPLFILVNTSFKKDAEKQRPFKALYQTSTVILEQGATTTLVKVTGEGTATHLGRSTIYSETTLERSGDQILLSGSPIFTAANGDELYTTFTGIATPTGENTYSIVRDYTVTGGTGRFADASGHFTASSTGSISGSTTDLGTIRFEGYINY